MCLHVVLTFSSLDCRQMNRAGVGYFFGLAVTVTSTWAPFWGLTSLPFPSVKLFSMRRSRYRSSASRDRAATSCVLYDRLISAASKGLFKRRHGVRRPSLLTRRGWRYRQPLATSSSSSGLLSETLPRPPWPVFQHSP